MFGILSRCVSSGRCGRNVTGILLRIWRIWKVFDKSQEGRYDILLIVIDILLNVKFKWAIGF
jgi:hypothetical protein